MLDQDYKVMRDLVDSFRPVETLDADRKRMEMKIAADQGFDQLLAEEGETIFVTEFGVLALRLADLDMEDPEDRLRAMKALRPFETFAKQIDLETEELESLWESLHEAEKGRAERLKAEVERLTGIA